MSCQNKQKNIPRITQTQKLFELDLPICTINIPRNVILEKRIFEVPDTSCIFKFRTLLWKSHCFVPCDLKRHLDTR